MRTETAVAQATIDLQPAAAQPLATIQQQSPTVAPASQVVVTPADLLRIAMESGDKDIERLERLMAMDERYRESQERERQRQAVLAFKRDFAALRGENVIVPKTKYVDRGKAGSFMQAEYSVVADMLSPALSKHGFSFRHDVKFGSRRWVTDGVESDIGWVFVTCFLEHRDGHSERLDLEGPPGELSANTPVQNMQVTASYLKRQSLLAITGTATADEDDENGFKRKGNAGSAADRDADELETLRADGKAKALEGMAALTAWWGALTKWQRDKLAADFGPWKRGALASDKAGVGRG